MKKISIVIIITLLNIVLFSCTPEAVVDEIAPQTCCGENEEIPPPPPPPPGG